MSEIRKALVVPTIRETRIKEDNPTRTFDLKVEQHYSWQEIVESVGDAAWIFSRRDSAIRSFGFLAAYKNGADFILTLDDDCYPYNNESIIRKHIEAIVGHTRWSSSIPDMRTRGMPYRNKGHLSTVVANMGYWSGVPDLDSIQSISNPIRNFTPPTGNRLIPNGQYVPVCGMNLCFRREATPLMYFPLMGEGQPYRRFDDIWCGIIFKKIIDHLRWHLSVGQPFVEHIRASDDFVNLVNEAPGIKANETFWEEIDSIKLTGSTPYDCMLEVGEQLSYNKNEYIAKVGLAILTWISLFE
jgi:reversibly glycosylated polypeptide / UDP-arabinopyranose mutase